MKRFAFRLQRLLRLKEKAEQQQAKKLADAIRDVEAMQTRVDETVRCRERAEDHIGRMRREGSAAGMMTVAERALRAVRGESDEALRRFRRATAKVADEQGSFDAARQARKSLEKLRDKQYSTWLDDLNRKEQEQVDAVAARMKRKTEGAE